YLNKSWDAAAKKKGMNYQSWNYTADAPTELLKRRIGEIVAENIYKLACEDNKLGQLIETFYPAAIESGLSADEILGNVMSLLMETMNYRAITESQKEHSCDEDFRNTKRLNYAKDAHEKRYNHIQAKKLAKVPMDETIESQAAAPEMLERVLYDLAIEHVCKDLDDTESIVIKMLWDNATQQEIAKELGMTQSAVSKMIVRLREKLEPELK
ncbi:MAG: hypothetical protein J6X60_01325, partial [Ruminiclostridium sp.]|nr:hypothetical protein [Ruminiclostridium sp.]